MSDLVLQLSRVGYGTISTTSSQAVTNAKAPVGTAEIIFLGITLICLQSLDGLLTSVGVMHLGYGTEANLMLRTLMISWGIIPAMVTTKLLAVAIIMALCFLAKSVTWVSSAMKGIIILYLCAAIVPWVAVFAFRII